MFLSEIYKGFSYSSFHFRDFLSRTCIFRVMQGSAFLALEPKCMRLFTSIFIVFQYESFSLATKVGLFAYECVVQTSSAVRCPSEKTQYLV